MDYPSEDLKADEEKEKGALHKGVEEEEPRHEHHPSDEVPFDDKPAESVLSCSDHPAAPFPTTTTLPATHPATSSPTNTSPMAERPGLTGMPYCNRTAYLWIGDRQQSGLRNSVIESQELDSRWPRPDTSRIAISSDDDRIVDD